MNGFQDDLLDRAFATRAAHFSDDVHLFVPSLKRYETSEYRCGSTTDFVAVSVTGPRCQLGCDHCRGLLLEHMREALTPEALLALATDLAAKNAIGILLSGGSDRDGRVPLAPFMPVVGRIRRDLGLKVVVHTGLVDPRLAEAIAHAGVECAMLDVIGDDETLRSVTHLEGTTDAIEKSLHLLRNSGVRIVPHVVVGIDRGRIVGEYRALELIERTGADAIVLVVLDPLPETPMAGIPSADLDELARIMATARLSFPEIPVMLGCARPGGRYRADSDRLALRAGLNGIAFPADGTAKIARDLGLVPSFHPECCSLAMYVPGATRRS